MGIINKDVVQNRYVGLAGQAKATTEVEGQIIDTVIPRMHEIVDDRVAAFIEDLIPQLESGAQKYDKKFSFYVDKNFSLRDEKDVHPAEHYDNRNLNTTANLIAKARKDPALMARLTDDVFAPIQANLEAAKFTNVSFAVDPQGYHRILVTLTPPPLA